MNWEKKYTEWIHFEQLSTNLKQELDTINDKKELEERFYRYLEFGTGGMRGELGVGINRINSYTVRRVTLGLAEYLLKTDKDAASKGVVVSYDSRHFSKEFAEETAFVLADKGIKVFLSDELRPTPLLSFLVREFEAAAGVMITASHNPSNYNGYKIYGEDGGQITQDTANYISKLLNEIDNELFIPSGELEGFIKSGKVIIFSKEVEQLYLTQVTSVIKNPSIIEKSAMDFKIVYSPLHGTGLKLVESALRDNGFKNLQIVKEQAIPDGDFPTVYSPNPEEKSSFLLAMELGAKEKANILMATDPDADRLGVAVLNEQGSYQILNGNQLGVLLLNYLLLNSNDEQLKNAAIIKTIVTSDLGTILAEEYGVKVFNTLTGFKYIGEKITQFEKQESYQFIFGYEESFGYLIRPFVRDKDAVQAALLTAEVGIHYNEQGKTLLDALDEIYKKYGYYLEALETMIFNGAKAEAEMLKSIEKWRETPPQLINGIKVVQIDDYLTQESKDLVKKQKVDIKLPKSNVLKFYLIDGSWICIRPSGTEQKCKLYFSVHEDNENEAQEKLTNLKIATMKIFDEFKQLII